MMERIIEHVGSDLKSLCVDSKHLAEDVAFIKKEGIKSITLIPRDKGYRSDNVDFLAELPFLEEIHMGACEDIKDYTGLKYVPNLTTLIFSPRKARHVDLSELTKLLFLSFHYNKGITGLERLTNLSQLWVWGGNETFFSPHYFREYKMLKELHISLSRLDDFLFLKECPVEELEMYWIKGDYSLNGMESIADTLRLLRIMCAKKAHDIDRISALRNLRQLIISDSFALKDCNIIKDLSKLEVITMRGTSYFENGDLSPLKDIIANLKHNYINPKKHYQY